jgi:hypothetical protein
MGTASDRLVPKVHPATRPVEPEDPLTLHATPVAGDPEVMLRCLVQEYAWMGWDLEQLLSLFRDPFYPALNALRHLYGDTGLRERLDSILKETGVFHCQVSVREEEEPAEPEPELIQLGMRGPRADPKGGRHAHGL